LFENAAVTFWLEFTVTTQLPVPLHAPPQPENVEPLAALAVNVTCVPGAKLAPQVCGQSIPAGKLVTRPLPVSLTVSEFPAVIPKTTPQAEQ
jgi:hypothetical protein